MSGIIPLHPEPWSEITPGLWQGGHDFQPDPDQYVLDACIAPGEFDLVVSLYRRHGIGVPDGIAHRTALIPDGPLTDDELAHVRAHAMANDGTLYAPGDLSHPDGPRYGEAVRANHQHAHLTSMYRVGKKAAGRELDDRTWDEYPKESRNA